MNRKKLLANKWYILYTLVPIIFFLGLMIAVKVQPTTTVTLYGVKDIEVHKLTDNREVNDFKVTKLVLMNGEVINSPTKTDIVERGLTSYRTAKEFSRMTEFEVGMLN
jgi:hypothetical protein